MQLPGPWELVVIIAVALLIFGPRRLPEIGQALGKGIREFRTAVRDASGQPETPQNREQDHQDDPQPRA